MEIRFGKGDMVDLRSFAPEVVVNLAKYQTPYVRRLVARKLQEAVRCLPSRFTLLVTNAWRPAWVQERYEFWYTRYFKKTHPAWSASRVKTEVRKYVHPSSGPRVSGHLTGGAVDVYLYSLWNRRRVPLESRKLTFEENAKAYQSRLPVSIRKNRELMFRVLSEVGLVNYKYEYWHWSYGDRLWAEATGQKLIFNIIQSI